MKQSILFFLILFFAKDAGLAKDTTITFIPPPMEGRVSIGVFSEQNRCVRVLKSDAVFSEFQKEPDGLSILWDRKLGNDLPASEGNYTIKGVVASLTMQINKLKLENNDWPASDIDTRIVKISAIATIEYNGETAWIVLAQQIDENAVLFILSQNSEVLKTIPLHFTATMLATEGSTFLVANATSVFNEQFESVAKGANITAIALHDGMLYFADGTHTQSIPVKQGMTIAESFFCPDLPETPSALTVSKEFPIAILQGKVFFLKNNQWEIFNSEAIDYAASAVVDSDDTLWITDFGKEFPGLKQFTLEGEFLRYLEPEPAAPWPSGIASINAKTLLLLERDSATTTVRALNFDIVTTENGESFSTWNVGWERTITASRDVLETKPIMLTLPPNALEQNKSGVLSVTALIEQNKLFFSTESGLPILKIGAVSSNASFRLQQSTERNDLELELHDQAGTAHCTIQNARKLLLFQAGTYFLNP